LVNQSANQSISILIDFSASQPSQASASSSQASASPSQAALKFSMH
jgi:hypothetical protein